MGIRTDEEDTTILRHLPEQQVCEEKMRQVIYGEGHLETVRAHRASSDDLNAGIQHQRIDQPVEIVREPSLSDARSSAVASTLGFPERDLFRAREAEPGIPSGDDGCFHGETRIVAWPRR